MPTILYFGTYDFSYRREHIIEGRVIWNCEEFLKKLGNPPVIMHEPDFRPKRIDDTQIKLCGWTFNIQSVVCANATSNAILEGWQMINTEIPNVMDRLIQPLFYKSVREVRILHLWQFSTIEPSIIELLRLSYWYYKCSNLNSDNTFQLKKEEIEGKLVEDLLNNIEEYRRSIKDSFTEDGKQFLLNLEREIRAGIAKPIDTEFYEKYLKQVLIAVWSVISELMFAALSGEYGSKISFETSGGNHDYDFVVKEVPAQVKMIIPEFKTVELDDGKIRQRIRELLGGRQIEEMEVEKEIIYLLTNYAGLERIKKAIRQGGRIICISGTQRYAGFLLNQWASDNKYAPTLKESLTSSFELLNGPERKNYLPVIFWCSGNGL